MNFEIWFILEYGLLHNIVPGYNNVLCWKFQPELKINIYTIIENIYLQSRQYIQNPEMDHKIRYAQSITRPTPANMYP